MPILDVNLVDGAIVESIIKGLDRPVKTIVDLSNFVYLQLPHKTRLLWRVVDREWFVDNVRRYGTRHIHITWSPDGPDMVPTHLVDPTGARVPLKTNKETVTVHPFYKAVEPGPVPWPKLDDLVCLGTKIVRVDSLMANIVLFTHNEGKTWCLIENEKAYWKNMMTHALNRLTTLAEMFGPVDRSKMQLSIKYMGSSLEPILPILPILLFANETGTLKAIDERMERDSLGAIVHVKYLA